ncbi:MAG: hypothetical protein HOW73_37675 [Polyangiaceae bacterium]|nr:hypothetical protein [Polyangiaceae bacterium]
MLGPVFRFLMLMGLGVSATACAMVVFDEDPETEEATGGGPASGGGGGGPDDKCPAPTDIPELPADALGDCSNDPRTGALTQEDAENLLGVLVHEATHLSALAAGQDGGLFTWTSTDGSTFAGELDSGYVSGRFSTPVLEDGATTTCAVIEFGCWTGGHGGWGPSALAGVAFITVTMKDEVVTHIQIDGDSLWLVESEPLSGTPKTPVDVDVVFDDAGTSSIVAVVGNYGIRR